MPQIKGRLWPKLAAGGATAFAISAIGVAGVGVAGTTAQPSTAHHAIRAQLVAKVTPQLPSICAWLNSQYNHYKREADVYNAAYIADIRNDLWDQAEADLQSFTVNQNLADAYQSDYGGQCT